MRPEPVAQYPEPAYPTKQTLPTDGSPLREHVPGGWQAEGVMPGALAFLLALAAPACASNRAPETPASSTSPSGGLPPVVSVEPPALPGGREAPAEPPPELAPSLGLSAPASAVVAPIFEHGEGRGATGCVVISPPVFLSEDEALVVIREELARAGIQLSRAKTRLPEIRLGRRQDGGQAFLGEFDPDAVQVPGTAKPLDLDAQAPDGSVGVEYVSNEDYFWLGGVSSSSSVQSFEIKQAAASLAKRLGKDAKPRAYFGVFYDPMPHLETLDGASQRDSRTLQADGRARSQALLRDQVRDFVAWLRQQASP